MNFKVPMRLVHFQTSLVIFAFSTHSLFEGIAIGSRLLEETSFKLQCLGLEETESGVWKLLMAVAVHSSAVAFCIGSELVAKGVLLNNL